MSLTKKLKEVVENPLSPNPDDQTIKDKAWSMEPLKKKGSCGCGCKGKCRCKH